uniref:Uncharacterized protein n=1 Tax=Rhizophora mucronata TaxID=61149 RepID=A0A2P2KMZ8_RHIMU
MFLMIIITIFFFFKLLSSLPRKARGNQKTIKC